MPLLPFSNKPPAGGANTALSNLIATAINTSLISDTDSTDDLGSSTIYWANAYVDKIYLSANTQIYQFGSYLFIDILGGYVRYNFTSAPTVRALEFSYWSTTTVAWDTYNLGNIRIGGSSNVNLIMRGDITPLSDSTHKSGSSSLYWLEGYFDKLYLNATATLAGSTAGHLLFTGDLVPSVDDTEWVGEIGTPFKSIKGLVVKDTTNTKHYSVTVVNGALVTTLLD